MEETDLAGAADAGQAQEEVVCQPCPCIRSRESGERACSIDESGESGERACSIDTTGADAEKLAAFRSKNFMAKAITDLPDVLPLQFSIFTHKVDYDMASANFGQSVSDKYDLL